MNDRLRYAVFFSCEYPPNGGYESYSSVLQSSPEEIDWVWREDRPDLIALFQLQQFPCLVAFDHDWKRIAALTLTLPAEIPTHIAAIESAWELRRDELRTLLLETEKPHNNPLEVTTLLIREWQQRILSNWHPTEQERLSQYDVATAMLLSRFRGDSSSMRLWEDVLEEFATTQTVTSPTLSDCIDCIQIFHRAAILTGETEWIARLQASLTKLQEYIDPDSGFYEYRRKTSGESIENGVYSCSVSPAVQSKVTLTLMQAGLVLGNKHRQEASNLLEKVWHSAQFNRLGCNGKLPSTANRDNDPGDLNDFVEFAVSALEQYKITSGLQWLSRAEMVAALAVARYQTEQGWLDWFPVNSTLHGQCQALRETGLLAETAVQLSRITGNVEWEKNADRLLGSIGAEILRKPLASVSLVSAILCLFQRDITLQVDWQHEIPTEWRIVLSEWWNEIRIDWRNPSQQGVTLFIGGKSEPLPNPMTLQRLFTK